MIFYMMRKRRGIIAKRRPVSKSKEGVAVKIGQRLEPAKQSFIATLPQALKKSTEAGTSPIKLNLNLSTQDFL